MQSFDVRLGAFDPSLHSRTLMAWLREEHVRRWWGDPAVAYQSALGGLPDNQAVILVGGSPAGYVCWRELSKQERDRSGLAGLPEGLVDIDICIGDPSLVDRGVGSRALSLLLRRLREAQEVSAAGVGTSVENARAIRAFRKAGFRLFREFHDPVFGRCSYMLAEL